MGDLPARRIGDGGRRGFGSEEDQGTDMSVLASSFIFFFLSFHY